MDGLKIISGVVLSIILKKNRKSCDMQIFDKNGSLSTTNIGIELSNSSVFDFIYWILQLFRIECDSC